MKKLFYGMMVAFVLLVFAGCSQSSANKGTAPELRAFFLTEYKSVSNFDDFERFTTVTKDTPYTVVADFYDPDFDIKELHYSFNDFQTYDVLKISSQDWEWQYTCWDGLQFTKAGTAYIKAYIIDKAGNKSNILDLTITVVEDD